mmetsp:Transcript_96687/g.166679  ORF Transcript_96687/g.166679 Transcript_96687/m.166679 type:complete len:303 (-) Transcript_96687:147-1055(-)
MASTQTSAVKCSFSGGRGSTQSREQLFIINLRGSLVGAVATTATAAFALSLAFAFALAFALARRILRAEANVDLDLVLLGLSLLGTATSLLGLASNLEHIIVGGGLLGNHALETGIIHGADVQGTSNGTLGFQLLLVLLKGHLLLLALALSSFLSGGSSFGSLLLLGLLLLGILLLGLPILLVLSIGVNISFLNGGLVVIPATSALALLAGMGPPARAVMSVSFGLLDLGNLSFNLIGLGDCLLLRLRLLVGQANSLGLLLYGRFSSSLGGRLLVILLSWLSGLGFLLLPFPRTILPELATP